MNGKRGYFRLFLLLFALSLCCGCGQFARTTLDPTIPYGLLIKCRDFLTFCLFLVDQEKPYYNHIAQRYYYAMLTLASISYQWHKGHGVEYKLIKQHDEVWRLMPHDVKGTYGKDLKGLRTRCDYHYEETAQDVDGYRHDLSTIMGNSPKVFPQLEEKVRTDCAKFFGVKVTDESIKKEHLDALMKEISGLHDDLSAKLINTIDN